MGYYTFRKPKVCGKCGKPGIFSILNNKKLCRIDSLDKRSKSKYFKRKHFV